jgi:hypothetical protein
MFDGGSTSSWPAEEEILTPIVGMSGWTGPVAYDVINVITERIGPAKRPRGTYDNSPAIYR